MSRTSASEPLLLISTGGTIEKIYNPKDGRLGFGDSALEQWIKDARISEPYRTKTLMLVDSLDMTEQERKSIVRYISKVKENRVVVLHGTDTMVQTAKLMMLHRKQNQVVVFTGAMVPASVGHSDAFFNIGFALAAARYSGPGVYVAMGGALFEADKVRKNKARGIFEPLSLANTKPAKNPAQ